MANIIIGTTPTIRYTFNTIAPEDIVTAFLTIRQGCQNVIEKTLTDATVDEAGISWTLSQAETLRIGPGKATIMLNWKTSDGTRGASAEREIKVVHNHKEEVI